MLAAIALATPPGVRRAAGQEPAGPSRAREVAIERALAALAGEPAGGLAVAATLRLGQAARLEARVDLAPLAGAPAPPSFRVWAVFARLDAEPAVALFPSGRQPMGAATRWIFRAPVEVPDDFLDAAVVVEELGSGAFGAAVARLTEQPLAEVGEGGVLYEVAARPEAGPPAASAALQPNAISLLPPRRQPAVGALRFRILVSDPLVARVIFFLDGAAVADDDTAPFAATLDLGAEARPHTVRAVGLSREGIELGADALELNAEGDAFAVRIARLAAVEGGRLELEAEVSAPSERRVEGVEIWAGDSLVAILREPPFQATLEAGVAAAAGFVRVVARLDDGSELEDARVVGAPAERVEVNLVELYAVVTDREGQPVEGLGSADFTIRQGRQERPIERFGKAEEVPLVLGLVIDTSESMLPLMQDTRRAGARFLAETVRERDRAFLVDFDTQPRLAHPVSADVGSLLRAFGRLEPEGFTALYDAIVFSMLQFEGAQGRRALVLLTDGDDYRSKLGRGQAIDYARDLGVPVYILGLAGILDPRLGLRKTDLEGITEATGGRIFYVSEAAEISQAYARINAELRSQYLLAYTTDRPLTDDEIRSLRVEVNRKELEVRAVVGGRTLR